MKEKFHSIYRWVLAISLIVAAICLIAGCIYIYNLGSKPFSREIVAETFSKIAVPVVICLILTVLGFFVDLFLPDTHAGLVRRVRPRSRNSESSRLKKNAGFISNFTHGRQDPNTASNSMPGKKGANEAAPDGSPAAIFRIRCAIVAVGVILLVYGIATGGIAAVLTKAANICTECIGLG